MRYDSIADIYSANARVRERFLAVVDSISDAEADAIPTGEKWSAAHIVEHVAMVENSMIRICTKLAAAARDAAMPSDGSFRMSDSFKSSFFGAAETKIEAPERVRPTGGPPIDDSLVSLGQTSSAFEDLREDLARFDGTEHTFPHPHFGKLTAAEWMIVRGGHENRHADQLERILAKLRK
jgi:DinB superfamily